MKDDLLYFSNTVCSIPLNALTIQRLIYLDSDLLQDEFTDSNSFIMQDLLINADKNYVNIVLQNLSKAIQTNCGNNIELDNISIPENFGYSFTANNKETSLSKIYKEYKITPPQQDQFKIIWLKTFIQELKKIDFSIRSILQLPQKDYSKLKPVNVFELIEEYEVFTSKFQQKIEKEFLKQISKSDKLNFYFNKMLPDYIEKTDSYFSQFEEVRTSFKSQFGYLNNEYNSLNNIISKAQINEISKIERFFNKVDYNDFENLKNRFLSVISRIKSNQKLQQKEISNFLNELNFRISNMPIVKPLPPPPIVEPKPEQETPKTFDELFYNIELVQPSIDILKEIEPPLIDTDYNYIGRLKGIICVWIDELQRQGIVKHYSDRKIFASLIPQKIKRFSIDESMFGKYQSKAENNYRTDIKTKVSKIKLSQSSH